MATSMQVQAEEITAEQAVKEIVDIKVEEDERDPLEGLNNAAITEIYAKLKPEYQQLFCQFKKFHKKYYELHGHDAPSHQLTQGIIREMFSGIPAQNADAIAAARVELLATERLRDLCNQLGLAVPKKLQSYQRPEVLEYPPPPPPLCFLSQQEKQKQQLVVQQEQGPEQEDVKPDIEPPRRLATSYLGKPGLLHMLGTGDEDHIITRVVPGTAPLQEYEEDNPADIITNDYEMDDSDVGQPVRGINDIWNKQRGAARIVGEHSSFPPESG